MEALFSSGRIAELILVVMALEAIALIAWRRRRGHGPGNVAILANLLAGAGLLMALRACLVGGAWTETAAWLAIALLAHLADLALRLRVVGRG